MTDRPIDEQDFDLDPDPGADAVGEPGEVASTVGSDDGENLAPSGAADGSTGEADTIDGPGSARESETSAETTEPAQADDRGEGDGLTTPPDPAGAGIDVAGLRHEFDALNDRHLRLVAEFNNFRRRSEQERLGAWSRAQADLLGKLLDVLDDLQRVAELDLGNATVEAIMEGIDLVEKKFVRVLDDAGVEVIEPDGEPFDPERMEAMMRVPVESDEQEDTVAQVFQKGYSLKGILVRPARVSVYTQ